jgi:sugar phosphate isomerase/epimerase
MSNLTTSRRDFIKTIGAGALALSIPRIKLFAEDKYEAKIGLQLYSIRRVIEKEFKSSIERVAGMGYYGIETYALPKNITLKDAAKVFRENKLEIFSMHTELPIGDDRDLALRMADAYHCDRLVYHSWPPGDKYKNKAALDQTVEMYNEIASFFRQRGIRFGLHNHWFEFEKNPDGIYPFYYFLKSLDKKIFFEIDTYWAKVAGMDPAKIVKDFGKRVELLHIKDGPAVKGDRGYQEQVPAGQGVLDFPAIAKAGGENIKWMIVEFDEYKGDIFEGINQSYKFLTKNGLAKGKV